MRNFIGLVLVLIGGFLAVTFVPDLGAPPAIKVLPQTEQSIKTELKREQLQKHYYLAAVVASRVYRSHRCGEEFANLTGQMAVDFRLPVRVVAAIVVIESSCDSYKISKTHDVGLMQVNAKIWHYRVQELLDPQFNMRVGSRILASYIRSYGLVEGLHHYNGLGNPTNEYAEHVLRVAGLSS